MTQEEPSVRTLVYYFNILMLFVLGRFQNAAEY